MCSRRNKPVFQAVIFLGLVGSLGYCVFLYNTLTLKLDRSDRQVKKYMKHQHSLSAQLQVVYEHRARLEKTFEKEKAEHKKTKNDLESRKRDFLVNVTRTKHETRNRFNSLETQHRMLQAQHEQLQTEYNRLQQQHARLSSEHREVHEQQVQSFNVLKEQKDNEILGLEEQIKTFKQQTTALRLQAQTQQEDSRYYRNMHNKALDEIHQHKSTIVSLNQRLRQHKKLLQKYQENKPLKEVDTRHASQGQETRVNHKRPGGHKVGIADSRPGRSRDKSQPKASVPHSKKTNSMSHGEQQKAARKMGGKESKEKDEQESEEEADNDADQDKLEQRELDKQPKGPPRKAQSQETRGHPPVLPRQADRSVVQQPKQPGYKSSDVPVVVVRDTISEGHFWGRAAAIATTATPIRQVTPKPLTTKHSVVTRKTPEDESDGESKEDGDGEQLVEEEKVQKYLSQNLANKVTNMANQELGRLAQQLRQSQTQGTQEKTTGDEKKQTAHEPDPVRSKLEKVKQEQVQNQRLSKSEEDLSRSHQNKYLSKLAESEDSKRLSQVVGHVNSNQKPDLKGSDKQEGKKSSNQEAGEPKPVLSRSEKSDEGKTGDKIKNEDRSKSQKDKKKKENDSKDALRETEPKRPNGGEQYRRPIPRPGAVVKKAAEADNENLEPNGNEQKKSEAKGQEEDNESEDDEEPEEKDNSDAKPKGIPRPDAIAQPQNQPIKVANTQEKVDEDDAAENDDEAEEDNNEKQNEGQKMAMLRGLRQTKVKTRS